MSPAPPPTESGFSAVRRDKLAQQISRQLLSAMVSNRYATGDRLPSERELMAIFGSSRSAVREALGNLAAKGIITVEQGRNSVVNPTDRWNSLDPELLLLFNPEDTFAQLTELRRIIEPEMAALAAANCSEAQMEVLRLAAGQPIDQTIEQHVERDTRFHTEIARATGNLVLLIVMSSISELLRESRRRSYVVPGELRKAWEHHAHIFEAIERRDPRAAREAMAAHIAQVADALRTYVTLKPEAADAES